MNTEQYNPTEARKQRGLQIAQTCRIIKSDKGYWKVPSQSGAGYYKVKCKGDNTTCNCKDHHHTNGLKLFNDEESLKVWRSNF